MISTIRYTSFKDLGMGKIKIWLVLLIGAFGMLLWLFSQYVLLIITVTYVSHGVLFYLAGLLNPRKRQETSEATN